MATEHHRIGAALVSISEPKQAADGKPSQSPVYRNILSENEFPQDFEGSTTLYEIFNASVHKYADRRCLGERTIDEQGNAGPFKWYTYQEVHDKSKAAAGGFVALGATPKTKIGVYAVNCPEWMMTIKAVDYFAGAIVPVYDSLGATAVEYICNHSELTIAVIEGPKLSHFADAVPAVKDTVKAVVYLGAKNEEAVAKIEAEGLKVVSWEELEKLGRQNPITQPTLPTAEDIATIMYTSGTTGTPKGVILTHSNLVGAVAGSKLMTNTQAGLNLGPDDSMLSFLTLAHSYGRQMEEFVLSMGASTGYWQKDVKKLMDDLVELKPTVFVTVPRILERIVDGVEGKLKKGSGAVRALFNAAFTTKLFMLKRGVPHWLAGLGWTDVIFKKIQGAMGGRVKMIVSGGAPLAPHVEDFCTVCLAPVFQGYGLTETCAGTFIMLPDPRMAKSVGPPLATAEFRLESCPDLNYDALTEPPQGEVLIRGPVVFKGYYKDEAKYKAEVDEDGWFHTGDIGTVTKQGCLKIIDRKKNMFKLAQGEYVAAEYLESVFSRTEAVDQIWVYGNSLESSLIAVVVPHAWWMKKADFGGIGGDEAVNSDSVKKAMLDELTKTGKEAKLKGFEMIKAVHLTTHNFSVEDDTMTQSLKLKRPQLQKKFQKEIDDMYAMLKAKQSRG